MTSNRISHAGTFLKRRSSFSICVISFLIFGAFVSPSFGGESELSSDPINVNGDQEPHPAAVCQAFLKHIEESSREPSFDPAILLEISLGEPHGRRLREKIEGQIISLIEDGNPEKIRAFCAEWHTDLNHLEEIIRFYSQHVYESDQGLLSQIEKLKAADAAVLERELTSVQPTQAPVEESESEEIISAKKHEDYYRKSKDEKALTEMASELGISIAKLLNELELLSLVPKPSEIESRREYYNAASSRLTPEQMAAEAKLSVAQVYYELRFLGIIPSAVLETSLSEMEFEALQTYLREANPNLAVFGEIHFETSRLQIATELLHAGFLITPHVAELLGCSNSVLDRGLLISGAHQVRGGRGRWKEKILYRGNWRWKEALLFEFAGREMSLSQITHEMNLVAGAAAHESDSTESAIRARLELLQINPSGKMPRRKTTPFLFRLNNAERKVFLIRKILVFFKNTGQFPTDEEFLNDAGDVGINYHEFTSAFGNRSEGVLAVRRGSIELAEEFGFAKPIQLHKIFFRHDPGQEVRTIEQGEIAEIVGAATRTRGGVVPLPEEFVSEFGVSYSKVVGEELWRMKGGPFAPFRIFDSESDLYLALKLYNDTENAKEGAYQVGFKLRDQTIRNPSKAVQKVRQDEDIDDFLANMQKRRGALDAKSLDLRYFSSYLEAFQRARERARDSQILSERFREKALQELDAQVARLQALAAMISKLTTSSQVDLSMIETDLFPDQRMGYEAALKAVQNSQIGVRRRALAVRTLENEMLRWDLAEKFLEAAKSSTSQFDANQYDTSAFDSQLQAYQYLHAHVDKSPIHLGRSRDRVKAQIEDRINKLEAVESVIASVRNGEKIKVADVLDLRPFENNPVAALVFARAVIKKDPRLFERKRRMLLREIRSLLTVWNQVPADEIAKAAEQVRSP